MTPSTNGRWTDSAQGEGTPDPLAEVWLNNIGQILESAPGYWETRYGLWAMSANKDLKAMKAKGWTFCFAPAPDGTDGPGIANLAAWLTQMAKIVSAVGGQPTASTSTPAVTDGKNKPRAAVVPMRITVPVPEIQEAAYVSGDRLQLKWADAGKGFTYRILYSKNTDNPSYIEVEDGKTVETAGAVVDIYTGQKMEVWVVVQAMDPEGHPSEFSQPVPFEVKPWNKEFSVRPLPPIVVRPLDPKIAAMVAAHKAKGPVP